MLKSVKFQSRDVPVQEITLAGEKPVFDIPEPEENEVSMAQPPKIALKIRKDTRATRSLLVEWTAEVSAGWRGVSRDRDGDAGDAEGSSGDRQEFSGGAESACQYR